MTGHIRKATHGGKLEIGDLEIPCFVLEDGTRVISGRGMTKAIGMKGRGQGVTRITASKTLSPFFSNELRLAIQNPIRFVGTTSRKGNPTSGYEATILHELCETVLSARDASALRTEQERRYAQFCEALVRAFAKVGIIALVDEATGYQEERDRAELHRILEAYIAKELLPWAKRFPDGYYKELFRLRGWQYSPLSVKRPQYVGKVTNDLVYERLPPGVLDELRRRNPVDRMSERRRRKHHQFLTEDVGHPHLGRHLSAVMALMRAAPNWDSFKRLFARAFPKPGTQIDMDLEEAGPPRSRAQQEPEPIEKGKPPKPRPEPRPQLQQ